jgi:hypothetical protein
MVFSFVLRILNGDFGVGKGEGLSFSFHGVVGMKVEHGVRCDGGGKGKKNRTYE